MGEQTERLIEVRQKLAVLPKGTPVGASALLAIIDALLPIVEWREAINLATDELDANSILHPPDEPSAS